MSCLITVALQSRYTGCSEMKLRSAYSVPFIGQSPHDLRPWLMVSSVVTTCGWRMRGSSICRASVCFSLCCVMILLPFLRDLVVKAKPVFAVKNHPGGQWKWISVKGNNYAFHINTHTGKDQAPWSGDKLVGVWSVNLKCLYMNCYLQL